MTDDRIGEIWRLPENYCKPLAFGRAIEAECRVPDGWQLVPMEPTASQLDVAVSFALNVNLCNDYNWSAYMRDVYARMIAAAPKPEKAEPDCECGAVASEHCPACEPVAQEPTAFLIEGFDGNGKRVAAVIQQNADNARNSASVFAEHYPSVKTSGLYLAPPDQSAEVERLKADWLRLYEELGKANNANYARIAELEATIEAQRTLYANCIKISHEADELEHKCHRLERQQKVLVEAMEKLARLGNGEHYGNSECNCIAIAALASVKGNA